MLKEKLDIRVLKKLKLKSGVKPDLTAWKEFLGRLKNPAHEVKIGLVGKYNELPDAYKSIYESFIHAGAVNECKVKVVPIHSELLEVSDVGSKISGLDGVLVAPGFGERGIKGKLKSIQYVRENNIPFFGICLGMQCAVVEYASNVLKLKGASSSEVKPKATNPVIDLMIDQKNVTNMGGTMRLGSYKCQLTKGSKAQKTYGRSEVAERHRHRYEFHNDYRKNFKNSGMEVTGVNPEKDLVEIVEIPEHPFFVGVQFHPELRSTVEKPHPLFVAFVKAASEYKLRQL